MGFLLLTLVLVCIGVGCAAFPGAHRDMRITAVMSFLIVWVSPFFTPATAHGQSDLDHLRFGGPIRFLEQNTGMTPLDDVFPIRISRLLNPQEVPTHILWGRFLLSVLLVAAAIWVLRWGIKIMRRAAS